MGTRSLSHWTIREVLQVFFLFLNIILFISFWLRRAFSSCGAQASHCSDFSCRGARALGAQASAVTASRLSSCGSWVLEHRLSSCGGWAWLPPSKWGFPGSGIKPVSPALAGGFFTLSLQGSPQVFFILWDQHGSLARWLFLGNCFK